MCDYEFRSEKILAGGGMAFLTNRCKLDENRSFMSDSAHKLKVYPFVLRFSKNEGSQIEKQEMSLVELELK
jgi:hypothetical protein